VSGAERLLDDALQVAATYPTAHLMIDYSGDLTGSYDLDAGAGVGIERTATSASTVQVRCRVEDCFVLTDAAGLTAPRFGLAAPVARKDGGRWVRVRPGTALYDRLSQGLSLASAIGSVRLGGELLDAGPTTFDAVDVEAIKGLDPDGIQAETVYVSDDTGLPVGFLEVGQDRTSTGHFTDWGEEIEPPVPQRVVDLS
jgi:hypothetical protein